MGFRQDQSGSISILFCAAVVIILGVLALAVDGGNAVRMRAEIQNAMDAAALAGARAKMMGGDAETAVAAAIAANWGKKHPSLPIIIGSVTINDGVVKINATAKSPAVFGPTLGLSELNMSLNSEAAYGVGDVEIALVLDNTMSMSGAKLEALKEAAHSLVDKVTDAPDADAHVRISLVPFGQYVNVGLTYRGASWLSVPDDYSTTSNQCWNTYPDAVSSNCHMETVNTTQDGLPYSYETEVCDWDYGDPVEVCNDITDSYAWHGCVGSRPGPLDVSDEVLPGAPVPGIVNDWCNSPLTRLGNNWSALSSEIDAQVASGDTYIPAGLLWGWRTLSHRAPFADGADPAVKPDIRKIVVLMTDGMNTRSPIYPGHDGWDAEVANQKTRDICTAIKGEQITVYTVAFQVSDAATLGLLSDCASDPIKAYNADSASELEQAFESIGGAIVALRLTK